jgi:hypothetical protein
MTSTTGQNNVQKPLHRNKYDRTFRCRFLNSYFKETQKASRKYRETNQYFNREI